MGEPSVEQIEHARVGAFFLGPKAENIRHLREIFSEILNNQEDARLDYFPEDGKLITAKMQKQESFIEAMKKLKKAIREISGELQRNSIPFWSPRYNAHMNMDTTLASIAGYTAAMMYNPNNVALEASPYTTFLEHEVGTQLCSMLGYNTNIEAENKAWGHITCDGSVANLEAIWSIRNLKYYPLSLRLAMGENQPLHFLNNVDPPFKVNVCETQFDLDDDDQIPEPSFGRPFRDLTTWELLNLRPSTILRIPTRLAKEYAISPTTLQDALQKFSIQSVGKEYFQREDTFNLKGTGKFFVSATKHYSWPKGGAISGLGSDNFIDIAVDQDARMDTKDLECKLLECIKKKIPVFGVVAIIGSTEHGACDPLTEVLKIRREFRQRGLSFAVHCDAAWGGYFASTIPLVRLDPHLPYVPTVTLREHTVNQILAFCLADSITIDPHKSGYINYPAGGLCYRDGRMRYLVTWTSPVVFHSTHEAEESMGVYGVEGSKPGAAAAATWATHATLGLNPEGYGRLLGEALFTSNKLYCHWATMTKEEDTLIVVPLNRLPAEKDGSTRDAIEEQKKRIRDKILGVTNQQLHANELEFGFFSELGGDLMINAFACNFKINGKPCQEIEEINHLNQSIFDRFSITKLVKVGSKEEQQIEETPLFLTSSSFSHKDYGDALVKFKQRLGLEYNLDHGDLTFLINVTMSPWPSDSTLLSELADSFKKFALTQINHSIGRNTLTPTTHGFVVQGKDKDLYFVHLPMFHMEDHRRQLIIKAEIPDNAREEYAKQRKNDPDQFFTIGNIKGNEVTLDRLLANPSGVKFRLDKGIPKKGTKPLVDSFSLTNIRVVVNEPLGFKAFEEQYPERMPFYLYGSNAEPHIDHVLKKAPNGQINTDCVALNVEPELSNDKLASGKLVAVFDNLCERAMQPLLLEKNKIVIDKDKGLRLVPTVKHTVSVYGSYDDLQRGTQPIARGTIAATTEAFADWEMLNSWEMERCSAGPTHVCT